MSLDHQKHVEACALLHRVLDDVGDQLDYRQAIEGWLLENHPGPEAYRAAMRALATGHVDGSVGVSVGEYVEAERCAALAPWTPPLRCMLPDGHRGAHRAGQDGRLWFLRTETDLPDEVREQARAAGGEQ